MISIYGVDTEKKVTPVMVRDAIITCFTKAHKDVLDQMIDANEFSSEKEFRQMKKFKVDILIHMKFAEVGADFDKPTKKNLLDVCDKLALYARMFRKPEVIKKHYAEILNLIDCIK